MSRAWRRLATGIVAVLLVAGSLWGQDDDFPLGPFRMFSRANRANGRVTAVRVEAVGVDGRAIALGERALGLRRAELEGQLVRFRTPDERRRLLALLDEAYRRRAGGDAPRLAELRMVEDVRFVRDGRPRESTSRVVARYEP